MLVATVTIDHTKVAGDLTDYIVNVDLSHMPPDFWDTVANGGGDIRVYKSDGTTELAREVVSCDTSTETGELYVKYSGTFSSSVDTVIQIHADGVSADYAATATYGRNAVWSDYLLVAHMNENPSTGGTPIINSTGGTNGSTQGTMTSGDLVAAQIENGLDFDGSNDEMRFANTNYQNFNGGSNIYVSAWIKTSADGGNIFDNRTTSTVPFFTLFLDGGKLRFANRASSFSAYSLFTTSVNNNAWRHIVVMRDGSLNGNQTAQTAFVDGASDARTSHTTTGSNTNSFSSSNILRVFGGINGFWNGQGDEFRLGTTLRSANWITTEYNNQSSPSTFYTASAVTTTSIKSYGGVAIEDIKSIAGVAIEDIKSIAGVSNVD
jgi:hypothetical protein